MSPTRQDAGETDGQGEDGLFQKLIDEFKPVLDESLIFAIANERNINTDYDDIRDILTSLAATADVEQSTGFDPHGLGSLTDAEGQASDELGTSQYGLSTEDATTISDSSDNEIPQFTHQADLSEADKVENLQLIFPNFKEHTIKLILKTSGGNLERAFDDLLGRQHLDESGELPKGVDGFYAPDDFAPPSRKNKSRNRGDRGKNKLQLSYNVVSPLIDDVELEGASGPVQRSGSSRSKPSRLPGGDIVLPQNVPLPQSPSFRAALPDMEASRATLRYAATLRTQGPLGRQASGYYIQQAREEARVSLAKASGMAEALVNQQSTSTKIDLHGVTVLDGVRIAKHRVWQWWDNLGEGRERIANQQCFTVVTGIGRHSAGGVSRLRQAVGAALRNDGWKVEALTGQFLVSGRTKV